MAADQNPLLNPLILYHILLYLPQIDLLLSQRVCSTWRYSIQTSHRLQETLYFRSESSDPMAAITHFRLNPLLASHFPDFFFPRPATPSGHRDYLLRISSTSLWHRLYTGQDASARRGKIEAYRYAEASWRRMLPCQPAPTERQITHTTHGFCDPRHEVRPPREGAGGSGGGQQGSNLRVVISSFTPTSTPPRISESGDGGREVEAGPVWERFLQPTLGPVYELLQSYGFPGYGAGRGHGWIGVEVVEGCGDEDGAGEDGGKRRVVGWDREQWRPRYAQAHVRVVLHSMGVQRGDVPSVKPEKVLLPKPV